MFSTESEWFFLILAASLIVGGWMTHSKAKQGGEGKLKPKLQKKARGIGIAMGGLGGVALIATMARDWVDGLLSWAGYGFAPIVLLVLFFMWWFDYMGDKKMDKQAFVAITLAPMFVFFGLAILWQDLPGLVAEGAQEARASVTDGIGNN